MASRKEEKEALRKARQEQEAADQARKAKQAKARTLAAVVGGIVIVAAVVAVVVLGGGSDKGGTASGEWPDGPAPTAALKISTDPGDEAKLTEAAKAAGCEINENQNEGRTHEDPDSDFTYKANPPTSGDHTPTWAEDGAYRTAEWETPYLVHGLEHGRVEYLWDDKKITDAQLGTLKKLYDDDPYHLILSPSTTKMPYAIAATAWDISLTCPTVNDDTFAALRLFRAQHIDQGPESVP